MSYHHYCFSKIKKKVLEGQQTIMKYFHDIHPYINKCTALCPLTLAAALSDWHSLIPLMRLAH